MQLKEIMQFEVETIRPDATLQQAAQKMAMLDIGILPVMEVGKVIGTITDRDITVRAIAKGFDPTKHEVRDAMTGVVVCAFEDKDIQEAARLMMDNQIRRLPILNRDHLLVGLVSLGDLALVVDDKQLAGQILERVCKSKVKARKPEMAM